MPRVVNVVKKSHLLLLACLLVGLTACGPSDAERKLRAENSELKAQLETQREDLELSQTQLSNLLDRMSQVELERDQARQQLHTETISNSDLNAKKDEAQTQVAGLQEQLALLQAQLGETQERETRLNASINDSLSELDATRRELETLRGELMGQGVDQSQQDVLISTLQTERDEALAQLADLETRFTTELEQVAAEFNIVTAALEDREGALENVQAALQESQRELEALQQQNDSLREQLDQSVQAGEDETTPDAPGGN